MYQVKIKRSIGVQVAPTSKTQNKSTQCPAQVFPNDASYQRKRIKTDHESHLTYDNLITNYLCSKEVMLVWLKDIGLLAREVFCPVCTAPMQWTKCKDRSDGYKYVCRKSDRGNQHAVERSVRSNTWFEKSNLTIEEIMKLTYWWCADLDQNQIQAQLLLSSNTIVDWCMFCREVCEVILFNERQQIGGEGTRVQIDESKVGKRKYHRGHIVEGQWVFGGIEEGSRKCFVVAVEDRSEKTLIPLIQRWIKPGTTIISDSWKGYINLNKYGYIHQTVNHSVEFVNENGDHTNKIEGHWKQLKSSLPTHGRRKHHYPSYFSEFMWRYINRDNDLYLLFLKCIKTIYDPSNPTT